MNEINAARVDLLNVYERLKRATVHRSRGLDINDPKLVEKTIITDDDYKIVNPWILNSLSSLADDLGLIEFAQETPLDKLSEELMKDGFIEMLENINKEEEDQEDSSTFMVHYRLPGYNKSGYRTGAVADLIYNALVQYVLRYWYQGLGLYDDMNLAAAEYDRLVLKIRNHSYKFKNKNFRRPYISL